MLREALRSHDRGENVLKNHKKAYFSTQQRSTKIVTGCQKIYRDGGQGWMATYICALVVVKLYYVHQEEMLVLSVITVKTIN
jgi:hypothetical protein